MAKRIEPDWFSMSLEELRATMAPNVRIKWERFCEELEKEGTEAEAYVRAGYKQKGAAASASRLIKNAKFAAFRRAFNIDKYQKQGISPEWVGNALVEVYQRCMSGTAHKSWDTESHSWVEDGTWVFNASGAMSALKALGESMGMFKAPEQKGKTDTLEVKILVPEDIE